MSSEWIDTTIGDQVQLQRGVDITKRDFKQGTIPVVSSGGIGGFHDTFTDVAPGVILGRKGLVGSVYYLPTDYWAHDTTLWVKDFKGNHPKYVYYFFRSIAATLRDLDVGSANPTLNRNHVHPIETRWAPIDEQKAIAHILGTLDDKIELNRKTNETLEAMAKALFKSWFVDFDPVRAKAEGRPTGLPAVISDLFPDSFEDSELGEIPSGWATGRLEEILEIDPPRQLRRGSVSPYLEMKGVPTSGHSAVDVILREFSSGSKFRNGDTLLARITPCLENGKTAFVDFLKDGEIGWGSTEFIVICGRREETNPFAYYLARSEVFRNNAIQNMVGSSGRQRVPSDAVSGFTLQMPPEEILVKFGLLASDLMRRISANADQSVILSKIRDTLLPKLISGELRIPDAEKMLEEVGV
jgi:type I restriction enzyme S subunit